MAATSMLGALGNSSEDVKWLSLITLELAGLAVLVNALWMRTLWQMRPIDPDLLFSFAWILMTCVMLELLLTVGNVLSVNIPLCVACSMAAVFNAALVIVELYQECARRLEG
ncbi:hypothetical protein F4823DRAFT_566275 [Ustulina deusta]|nr:hypothetical protein F4823DRAFT_566275 [Ustulina deusta]